MFSYGSKFSLPFPWNLPRPDLAHRCQVVRFRLFGCPTLDDQVMLQLAEYLRGNLTEETAPAEMLGKPGHDRCTWQMETCQAFLTSKVSKLSKFWHVIVEY